MEQIKPRELNECDGLVAAVRSEMRRQVLMKSDLPGLNPRTSHADGSSGFGFSFGGKRYYLTIEQVKP